jgi:hypothetical protein
MFTQNFSFLYVLETTQQNFMIFSGGVKKTEI